MQREHNHNTVFDFSNLFVLIKKGAKRRSRYCPMKSSATNSSSSRLNKLNSSSNAKQTVSNFTVDDSDTSSFTTASSALEAKTFLQHSFRKITATREYAFSKSNLRKEKWKVALFCGERNSVGHKNGPFKETRFDGLYSFCILQNGFVYFQFL